MAAKTDSFITFPRLPVSSSLPVPSTTFASTSSVVPPTLVQARPVTRPTWSLFGISSGRKRRGPKNFSKFAAVMTSFLGASSSTKRIAHLRQTAASSRSSVRTPDSLV